jgi:hypothetical protein
MAGAQFQLKVASNVKAIIDDARGITTAEQNRAAARALNRAAERARTATIRKIRDRYPGIKREWIADAIDIRRASEARLEVALMVRGRPLSLGRFDPRIAQRGAGKGQLSVKITGTRKVVAGAFVTSMKDKSGSQYSVVFRRVGKDRYPIEALKTIDIPGVFSREEAQAILEETAVEVFDAEFVRQLELILNRKAG